MESLSKAFWATAKDNEADVLTMSFPEPSMQSKARYPASMSSPPSPFSMTEEVWVYWARGKDESQLGRLNCLLYRLSSTD